MFELWQWRIIEAGKGSIESRAMSVRVLILTDSIMGRRPAVACYH